MEIVGIGEKILVGKLCGKVPAGKLAKALWNTISQVSIIRIKEIISSKHNSAAYSCLHSPLLSWNGEVGSLSKGRPFVYQMATSDGNYR